MSFLTESVSIPLWLLLLMIAAILPLLVKVFKLLYHLKQGDIVKEEQSDMVVWKIKSQRHIAVPKKTSVDTTTQKKQDEKEDLARVLKVLLKEGDKGVRIQTVADQLNINLSKVQNAMSKLVNKKLVEEVVGMSGTKYYLTQLGTDYCRRKAR